jgi:sorbitol-specific phosphotransferase system component IIC
MLRVLPTLILLVLTIYALVDCIQTEQSRQRNLPKALWLVLILLLPLIGPIAWFLAGRPGAAGRGRGTNRPPYPRGPDDDPDFLRNL